MGRDSDATGGPAGGSASDSQSSQAGSQGATGGGGRQSNPFGGSLSGPSRGSGGGFHFSHHLTDAEAVAKARAAKAKAIQDRYAAQRQARQVAKLGKEYAGYAGLTPNDIAAMRTDPAMRGLDAYQAASAMAAATGAMDAPEDTAADVAAKTYGYRRGTVSSPELSAAVNAAISDERSWAGKARDYAANLIGIDIDRTVSPQAAAKFADVTPDFSQAPSYAAGLPDVTSAYSRGLAYTDPETGMPTQDITGQTMEVFGDLAMAAAPAAIGAVVGTPLASAIGSMLTRGMMTPSVPKDPVSAAMKAYAVYDDPYGALAGLSPVTSAAVKATEMQQMNERLGIGQSRAQRDATVASARRSAARQSLEGGSQRGRGKDRQAPRTDIPMDTGYTRYIPPTQPPIMEDSSLSTLTALTLENPYAGNIYGLSPLGTYA